MADEWQHDDAGGWNFFFGGDEYVDFEATDNTSNWYPWDDVDARIFMEPLAAQLLCMRRLGFDIRRFFDVPRLRSDAEEDMDAANIYEIFSDLEIVDICHWDFDGNVEGSRGEIALLATESIQQLKARFGRYVPPAELRYRSAAEMAAEAAAAAAPGTGASAAAAAAGAGAAAGAEAAGAVEAHAGAGRG